VHERLRERGVPSELRSCAPRGDALLASVAFREGGTLLLGHLDTVWPAGSLAEMPWRLQGGRASGPGVFDMKAGIVVGMAVLAAMVRESRPRSVSLLLVPDEEAGSPASRDLTVSIARRHRRVLVLEPSLDGAAKVARKGCGTFHVRFRGRAAHAGLDPDQGASALEELARFVLFLGSVRSAARGTTLTASVARSGGATNVVPEAAELAVDARAWTREETERVTAALLAYRASDPRVTVSFDGGFDRPPLEQDRSSEALHARARRLAADLGFELGAARVGGASDGNFTAAAGIPTLDGLGPRGGGAHARDEHVFVADLPPRAALVAALASEPG
jgi:glutamate carboxypeptidase